MTQVELFDKGRTTMGRVEYLFRIAEAMGYDIQEHPGCCEPGYDDKPVVLGNWNDKGSYVNGRYVKTDDTMPRLAKLFEKLGYSVEWEDEWKSCDDCGKVFRVSPDSYSWTLSAWISDGGCQCEDCVLEYPEDYLDYLDGNSNAACTLQVDLEQHGWKRLDADYCSGWHPGQTDNPHVVADELRKNGVEHFIFKIDGVGQFQSDWSVYVRATEQSDE
jgi:hypothetical protein